MAYPFAAKAGHKPADGSIIRSPFVVQWHSEPRTNHSRGCVTWSSGSHHTNGVFLRLVRHYHHTFTKGYVQFDLEAILEACNYADFRPLYRMGHASRFLPQGGGKEALPPLERFYEERHGDTAQSDWCWRTPRRSGGSLCRGALRCIRENLTSWRIKG